MPVIGERAEIHIGRILVATDFSVAAERACAYAGALARRFQSTIDLVNVVDISLGTATLEGASIVATDSILQANSISLHHEERRLQGLAVESTILEAFSPIEALVKRVAETSPELVILGTHSRSGRERLLLGSTSERLYRRVHTPVLTVGPLAALPSPGPIRFRNIVYASSLHDESRKAATFALAFAQDSGAHLHLCHVIAEGNGSGPYSADEALASLERMLPPNAHEWCSPISSVEHGDTATAILGLAERVHADLIVLGPRQNTFRLKYLEAGTTPIILGQATCPVLTVR